MTNRYFLDRIAGREAHLRAADADRERTAERLRNAHGEGRLDMAEFQERLERCYAAKTLGELEELLEDLPRQDEEHERRAFAGFRPWRWPLAPLAPILLTLIVVSAVTGHHVFWLWVPLAFLFFWRITWWRRRHWLAGGRRGPGDWI